MTRENNDGWTTKIRKECEDGEPNGVTRGLGTLSPPSSRARDDSLRIGREDSYQSNTLTIGIGAGNAGGIARQLIEETKKQLAYHKTQVSDLEARIQELEQFTEDLNTQDIEEHQ
jgi:hypothetical protein